MNKKVGLPHEFIAAAVVQTAFEFEGVYNLMKMWIDETDKKERSKFTYWLGKYRDLGMPVYLYTGTPDIVLLG